jgi:hypothetical protein
MELSDKELAFLGQHHSAAMITVTADRTAKVSRVGVGLVDGKLWSSGTADRRRTERLRRDPRCTLFVFEAEFAWLALETTVRILEGPDAPRQNLRLFRLLRGDAEGPEFDEEQYLRAMVDEKRLIYEFEVQKSYGII